MDGENKSFVRVGQVETTTPFVPLEQVMDPVNKKRQGLTHFQAHTYSDANIDLAVHTHPHTHTKMAAILAVMQSRGKCEREALSYVYITVIM